jgi:hypothetical protein
MPSLKKKHSPSKSVGSPPAVASAAAIRDRISRLRMRMHIVDAPALDDLVRRGNARLELHVPVSGSLDADDGPELSDDEHALMAAPFPIAEGHHVHQGRAFLIVRRESVPLVNLASIRDALHRALAAALVAEVSS